MSTVLRLRLCGVAFFFYLLFFLGPGVDGAVAVAQAVHSTASGRDALISLPTGGGKSLCYQLLAVSSGGLAVVISPLIALIDDQLAHLRHNNIPAVTINSTLTSGALADVRADLLGEVSTIKLLYLTPEQIATHSCQTLLDGLYVVGVPFPFLPPHLFTHCFF